MARAVDDSPTPEIGASCSSSPRTVVSQYHLRQGVLKLASAPARARSVLPLGRPRRLQNTALSGPKANTTFAQWRTRITLRGTKEKKRSERESTQTSQWLEVGNDSQVRPCPPRVRQGDNTEKGKDNRSAAVSANIRFTAKADTAG